MPGGGGGGGGGGREGVVASIKCKMFKRMAAESRFGLAVRR